MKKEELFEKAFDFIDDKMIADAQTIIPIVKRKRTKTFLVAACIALLLSALFFTLGVANTQKETSLPSTVAPPGFLYPMYGGASGSDASDFSYDTLIILAACLLLLLSVYLFYSFFTPKKRKKVTAKPYPTRRVLIATVCPLVLLSVLFFSLWIANQEPNVPTVTPTTSTTSQTPETDPTPITVAPGQYYEGDIHDTFPTDSSWGGLVPVDTSGFAISCELIEVLPARYLIPVNTSMIYTHYASYPQEYYSSHTFRLLKMKSLSMPWGRGMENDSEFFFLLPESYLCDFSKYESFLFSYLAQRAYDYFVLYNQDTSSYESFSLPLFEMKSSPSDILAFDENGIFDVSLWTANEAWSSITQTKRQKIEDGLLDIVGSSRSEIEASLEDKYDYQVYSLSPLQGEAFEAFNYCRNPENGLYLPILFKVLHERDHQSYHEFRMFFRRFIGGYPTNETLDFRSYERVSKSDMKFTESDLNTLPDLASALKQVSESYHQGKLTPPHIQDLSDKTLSSYGIFGWYEKTENGVLGIVRVSWKYTQTQGNNTFYDDQYFVITSDAKTAQSIDRDTLLKHHTYASDFIFQGEYDENGKVLDMWCA